MIAKYKALYSTDMSIGGSDSARYDSQYGSRSELQGQSGKKRTKMSNREEEWMMLEKRLIFACTDEEVLEDWVTSLSELVTGEY